MQSLEDISRIFEALAPARMRQFNIHALVPGRLYLTRTDAGKNAIFIEGDKASFGSLSLVPGAEHRDDVVAVPSRKALAALQLTSPHEHFGDRAIMHIAYELARRLEAEPTTSNATLINDVGWILRLLGEEVAILGLDKQKGLAGECILLRRLLLRCHERGLPPGHALQRWWGYRPAKRDFASQGVAIEVKTTSRATRVHHVGSLAQLDPQGPEAVYIFSVGIKVDPSSPRKLPHFIDEVESLLKRANGQPDQGAIDLFRSNLRAYGYDPGLREAYGGSIGFLNLHLPPRLFREADLDRIRISSFKGDALPTMVPDLAYLLEAKSEALTDAEEEAVLDDMLAQPPASYDSPGGVRAAASNAERTVVHDR